ncbi:MAG TPA: ribonuclease H [Candidatus Absconditabacterales bacterium]|nr:ribonuclease H [Candidatus Absconditabacterales bacterium]HMT27374.1 ribonuclease H [Candidatus Absconditabacterales bacterium]
MEKIVIYADGSCIGNPGPGGFAALILIDGKKEIVKGKWHDTTNNQMELMAVIQALMFVEKSHLDREIIFFLDSQYVLHGVTKYMEKWLTNGWRLATGKPVKNQEQWKKLHELMQGKTISWQRVEAHATDQLNNQVDELARAEAMKLVR